METYLRFHSFFFTRIEKNFFLHFFARDFLGGYDFSYRFYPRHPQAIFTRKRMQDGKEVRLESSTFFSLSLPPSFPLSSFRGNVLLRNKGLTELSIRR